MSLNFKVVQKAQPGVAGGGERKFYAQIVYDEKEFTLKDLVKEIEKFSALSQPDIEGVIIALENVIQNKLADSKIVRMRELGSFYPTLSSSGVATADEVSSNIIRKTGVRFRPGSGILKAVRDAGFYKMSDNVQEKPQEPQEK